jgi:hypothetical protein
MAMAKAATTMDPPERKAHSRVKLLPEDWRFQVAKLEGEWWINKVCTYGMASAQLYWGRTAALILRLLYNIFPQVDWGFVFVDDFCWLLRAEDADHVATAMLATLMALGVPLSWKKTHLAEVDTWLGFVIHPNIPQVQMIATKHTLVLEVLELLIQNTAMTTKSIESLGRLQWAIAVCPLTKSLLQPSWAWKMGLLALLMKELFNIPYQQLSPYLPKSQWWGCSDASAAATGEAYMGGWLSDSQSPAKTPYWRSPLLERQYPQTRPHTGQTPEAHTRVSKALPAPVEHQGRHRQVTHRPTLRIHTTGTTSYRCRWP